MGILAMAPQAPPELWERVQTLIAAGEENRVVEWISDASGPEAVADNYHSVVRSLYYSAKDLPAVVLVAQEGIDYDFAQVVQAERRGDSEAAAYFRGRAKELAYDLASFTWPGWNEPGIDVRTSDLEAGFEAARLNFRLAEELERGPEAMANAHFILGGHALAAGDYGAAEDQFRRFKEVARQGGLEEMVILADGYAIITDAAARSGNPGTYLLEPVRMRFREAQEAESDFWIEQLETAWSVFVTG